MVAKTQKIYGMILNMHLNHEADRKLLDGTYKKSFDSPITITIYTKCPGKWKLIDMETGQEYIGVMDIPDNHTVDLLKWIREGNKTPVNIHYGSWENVTEKLQ